MQLQTQDEAECRVDLLEFGVVEMSDMLAKSLRIHGRRLLSEHARR